MMTARPAHAMPNYLVEKTPLVEIPEKGVFYTNAPQVRLLTHVHST
jgi:hypothetical protein